MTSVAAQTMVRLQWADRNQAKSHTQIKNKINRKRTAKAIIVPCRVRRPHFPGHHLVDQQMQTFLWELNA